MILMTFDGQACSSKDVREPGTEISIRKEYGQAARS